MTAPTPNNSEQQPFPHDIVVLLVDDQAMVGEAVRRMLATQDDIQFHFCKDPQQALQRAVELRPTVILQDLVMPEVDGLDLVPQYRQQDATRDTPLIVLSTREEPVTKAEAFARGANDYLVKLPNPVELLARIRYHSRGYISLLQRNAAYEELEQSRQRLAAQIEAGAKYLRALLPAPLKTPIEVDWRYIPSADLGGDTFGYHWLDDEHFAFYLVDVAGHGLDSALLSVTIMNVLRSRALAETDFREPGQVLKALNDTFPMEDFGDKFFTIWYGVLNAQTRTLAWSGGGHPPALLFEGEPGCLSTPEKLESQGPMIGMMPWPEFESGRRKIQSPAKLYIYSDGVHEILQTDGTEWPFDAFLDFLASAPKPDETKIDALLQHVRVLRGSEMLDDDFSMLEVTL